MTWQKYARQTPLSPWDGLRGSGLHRNMAAPELRRYQDYNAVGHPGGANPIRVELRDRRYEAISIGPGSDLDAVTAVIEGVEYPLDLASPLIRPIEDTLDLLGWYGRYSDVGLVRPVMLDVLLWPTVPAYFPAKRGPKRNVPYGELDTVETTQAPGEVVDVFPCHGRATSRLSFRSNEEAVWIQIQAITVRPQVALAPTVADVDHAIWPTAGDPTAYHQLGGVSPDEELVIDTEGWEYLKILAYSATGIGVLEWWWSVHD